MRRTRTALACATLCLMVSGCSSLAPDEQDAIRVARAEVGESAGKVRSAWAEGQTAQVVFADDVVFLALFDGRWKVIAMECTPRPDRPYDCRVKRD